MSAKDTGADAIVSSAEDTGTDPISSTFSMDDDVIRHVTDIL